MEHCIVDGKRCSKCCEVLLLSKGAFPHSWTNYVRHSNHDVEQTKQSWGFYKSPEYYNVLMMIKPLKKRIAKKRNPHLFRANNGWVKQSEFFSCKHLTANGCGNYKNRPKMCSEYPHYGKTLEEWKEFVATNNDQGYSDDCTYFIEIKDFIPTDEENK